MIDTPEDTASLLPLYILAIEDEKQRELYASLYIKYESFMYQTAFKVLKNADDAEDAVHQVFLRLIKNRFEPDPDDPGIKAYLSVATKHAALDLLQTSGITIDPPEYPDSGFEESLVERMDLYHAISRLPGEYQQVLLLYYFSGLKIREIAAKEGVSYAAVQKRLERAKQMLSDILNRGEND